MRIPNVAMPVLFFVGSWLTANNLLRYLWPETYPWWIAAAVGLLFGVMLSVWMKQKLVGVHRSNEKMVPTSTDRHPGIDLAALESLTAQLGALGFETQIDYTVVRTPPNNIDGFARLFYNPTTHVFAEVNQVLLHGVPATPMALTLFSIYENEWSFSTMTKQPSKNTAIIYAMRRPKRLWQIIPGAGPTMAVERHLAKAQVLAAQRQLTPVPGDPVEAYLASQERQKIERYDVHRRRNLFAFLWDIDRYNWAPKLEWLGEAQR